jgi:hypothetical protein
MLWGMLPSADANIASVRQLFSNAYPDAEPASIMENKEYFSVAGFGACCPWRTQTLRPYGNYFLMLIPMQS